MVQRSIAIRLTLDDNFSRGVTSASRSARGLATSLDGVSRQAGRSGERAGTSFAAGITSRVRLGIGKVGGFVKTAFSKVGLGAGLGFAGIFGATILKGFQRLNAIDQAKAKLAGLGHSASEVASIMNDALTSVKGTAFGMDEAATAAATAVAAGIQPGKDLQRYLGDVADAATIAGVSLSDMAQIYGKVATSNKIQGDVIAQLGDKGIPIVSLLSKSLHKSASEVVTLASAGKINFAQFQKAMESGVGGAAQKSGQTFSGAMKNLQASLSRIGANLLSGIFPKLQGYATGITKSLGGVEDKASSAGAVIGTVLGGAITVLGVAFHVLGAAIGPVMSVVGGLASAFNSLPGPIKSTAAALVAVGLANRIFGSQIAAMRGGITSMVGAVRTFGSSMRSIATAQGAVVQGARGFSAEMGRFGSSIAQIGQAVPVVARMQSAFVTGAAGAARFARTAGLARAAMVGMRSVGSGLLSAVGGPFGLALAGAGVALTLWQKHQADAAAKVAAHKAQVQELTAAIQKDGNELGKASAQQIAKNIVDSNTIGIAKQMGISQETLTRAWMGQPQAMKSVNDSLDTYKSKALQNRDAQGRLTKGAGEQLAAIAKVRDGMNGQVKDTGDVISKNDQYAQSQKVAAKALKDGVPAADEYAAAQKRAADATKAAQDAASKMVAALDKVNNKFLELRGGERGYEAAIDDATAALKKNGKTLDDTTAKGRENAAALDTIASSAQTVLKQMGDKGMSAASITSAYRSQHDQLVKMAEAFGMSATAAKKYADQALALPKEVTTSYKLDIKAAQANLESARAAVKALGGDFDALPKQVQMKLATTGGKDAKKTLDDLGVTAKGVPKDLRLSTSTPGADGSMLKLKQLTVTAVTADGKIVQIPCSTPGQAKALHDVLALHGAQISADGKSVTIHSSAPMAADTKRKIDNIKGARVDANGTVHIDTSAPGAVAAYNNIITAGSAADRVNGKQATITITTRRVNEIFNNVFSGGLADGAILGAGGVRRMASGGVSRRQAMISGKPILWGEAGPEAYIPLGANKRNARTDRLFRATAGILGYDVIRKAADGYMSDWARARPASVVPSVMVQAGAGGGLSSADRALIMQSIQASQKVLAAMPAAVQNGLAGSKSREAQSAHLRSRMGG